MVQAKNKTILGKWLLMEYAHILTIGTARSGLNFGSDVNFGEPFLKLTKVLGEFFLLGGA